MRARFPELPAAQGPDVPLIAPHAPVTELFTCSGTGIDGGEPAIPGAAGCTLENRSSAAPDPTSSRAELTLRGISPQLPYAQAEFPRAERIPYPLLPDAAHRHAAVLRLPALRGAGRLRHKRLMLVVDAERTVRYVLFPVDDIPYAVAEARRPAAPPGPGPSRRDSP
ncbi:hypothetical protein ACWC4D_36850 [Streptomyces sp. NPDC001288]|uniref:hypothetical protein n=1 Tax=unclassified Streptomyces TaxID=2593676 RepID=UPI003322C8A3